MEIEERRKKVLEWSAKGVRQSIIAKRLGVSIRTVEEDMRAIRGSIAAGGPPVDVLDESFADTLAELEAECKKMLKDRKVGPRVKSSVLNTLTQIEKLKAEREPAGPSETIFHFEWGGSETIDLRDRLVFDAKTPEEAWAMIAEYKAKNAEWLKREAESKAILEQQMK